MKLIETFDHSFAETENCWIRLSDGCRLAAKLWLPTLSEGARIPCIIEVLPYRKRDAYAVRDSMQHRYFAGHGYASMRIDMRGSGDSDGHQEVFDFAREQDDTLEILDWIEQQAWSDGQVSMYGVSWGGLQAVQVASRRPPQLKSIVAVAFAHDHYVYGQVFFGGCFPLRAARWSAQMLGYKSRPPDPQIAGPGWRGIWLERLAHDVPQVIKALQHPLHDLMWKEQAVSFSDIDCPVYAVGGWADIAYVGSVLQALVELPGFRKGLIGPWGHNFPHFGVPGPAIGFLQEALRWFDHWMRGKATGLEQEPVMKVWMSGPLPPLPFYPLAPGRWVEEDLWPSARVNTERLFLNSSGTADYESAEHGWTSWGSPQSTGQHCGELMPWFQHGPSPELPDDQREDDGKSLCFDSEPLTQDLEILGSALAVLRVKVDQPTAFICVRLCDVAPDGSSVRAAIGVLNLARRWGADRDAPVIPGEPFDVRIPLVPTGYRFAAGRRLRVALSTSYWPLIWPSPEPVLMSVATGFSHLELPIRQPDGKPGIALPFAEPEAAPPCAKTQLTPAKRTRRTSVDAMSGEIRIDIADTAGCTRYDEINLETEAVSTETYRLVEGDPLSASADINWTWTYRRGGWHVRTETLQRIHATAEHFVVDAKVRGFENELMVFEKTIHESVPRNGN